MRIGLAAQNGLDSLGHHAPAIVQVTVDGRFCLLYTSYFVQSLALVSYGKVQNILSQFHEINILSHEVSFALQSDDNGKVRCV